MCWSDWAPKNYRVKDRERYLRISFVFAQVSDTTNNGFEWVYSGVATQAEYSDVTSHTIFLGIRGKGGKGCTTKLGISICGDI